MIYYHFTQQGRALPRDPPRHVRRRRRARRATSAALDADPPRTRSARFVDAIAAEAEARPHFPPIWFREIAEGGAHLDAATLARHRRRARRRSARIVDEGRRAPAASGRSTRCSSTPASSAPLLLYLRQRARCASGSSAPASRGAPASRRDEVVAHLQRVALGALEGRISMKDECVAIEALRSSCRAGARRLRDRAACGGARRRPAARVRLRRGDRGARRAARSAAGCSRCAVAEGDRVAAGDVIARLDTADAELAAAPRRGRARSGRRAARGCSRPARAPRTSGRRARRRESAQADVAGREGGAARRPTADLAALRGAARSRTPARASSATMRRRGGRWRRRGCTRRAERARAAAEGVARLRAGARAAGDRRRARARRRGRRADRRAAEERSPTPWSRRRSPASSPRSWSTPARSSRRGTPLVVVTDLDHAWANVYVDEPLVPRLQARAGG